ncbi:MAG: hotdog fold thioesterase [Pseudomonadota bacterium]
MKIWSGQPTLASITARNANSMAEHLGIEFVALTDNSISARMPVDHRTRQPFGLLHGGANVVLAETLGSVAGNLVVPDDKMVVGVEINANHLRAVRDGHVIGTTMPVHLGRSTQVWEIKIEDAGGKLSCVSRLTLAVVARA